MPHRAQVDRIEPRQLIQPVGRHHRAVLKIVVGTPGERFPLKPKAELGSRSIEDLDSDRNDFFSYTVSGYDSYAIRLHGNILIRRIVTQNFSGMKFRPSSVAWSS